MHWRAAKGYQWGNSVNPRADEDFGEREAEKQVFILDFFTLGFASIGAWSLQHSTNKYINGHIQTRQKEVPGSCCDFPN